MELDGVFGGPLSSVESPNLSGAFRARLRAEVLVVALQSSLEPLEIGGAGMA